MKKYNLVICLILLMSIVYSGNGYGQTQNGHKGETFQIVEGEIIDSTITRLLDSAFLFLKLPKLEFDLPYCFYLSFNQQDTSDKRLKDFYNVQIVAGDFFLYGISGFEEIHQFFINYKGSQILILLERNHDDNIKLYKYVRPTFSKSIYYSNYIRDGLEIDLINQNGQNKRYTEQTVSYILDTRLNKILFNEYRLKIYGQGYR